MLVSGSVISRNIIPYLNQPWFFFVAPHRWLAPMGCFLTKICWYGWIRGHYIYISTWNPKQQFFNLMLGETPICHPKIWNDLIETTIFKWMFRVPGIYIYLMYIIIYATSPQTICAVNQLNIKVSTGVFGISPRGGLDWTSSVTTRMWWHVFEFGIPVNLHFHGNLQPAFLGVTTNILRS